MTMQSQLIKEIRVFLAKHKMRESRFGRDAVRDSKFVYELFAGERSPQLRTVERVRSFMKTYRA
jgi:hypothetical protein